MRGSAQFNIKRVKKMQSSSQNFWKWSFWFLKAAVTAWQLRRCPTIPGWGALTARVPGPVQSGPCLEKTQRAPRLGFDLLLRSLADQRCLPLFLFPRLCKGTVLTWDSVWNFLPCFVVGLRGDEQTAEVRRLLRKSQPTPQVGLATFECGCVSEITLGHPWLHSFS